MSRSPPTENAGSSRRAGVANGSSRSPCRPCGPRARRRILLVAAAAAALLAAAVLLVDGRIRHRSGALRRHPALFPALLDVTRLALLLARVCLLASAGHDSSCAYAGMRSTCLAC